MPICPGCERPVSYVDLDVHQRYCHALGEDVSAKERSLERLEQRLRALESLLEGRFEQFEAEYEHRLGELEQ